MKADKVGDVTSLRSSQGNRATQSILAECDHLKAQNSELVEALKRFANLDNNVPSGTWAVDASYCKRAREVLAKVAAKP